MFKARKTSVFKPLAGVLAFSLLVNSALPRGSAYAQVIPLGINLPAPGVLVPLSDQFTPVLIKGIRVYPENPLKLDFIVDAARSGLEGEDFKAESGRLVRYFLASLTVPEDELWVNLSPYEQDRIMPHSFGETEMGRDLLAQDYLLKQITASLMYPEDELGERFWDRVYARAQEKYGTTDIPTETFHKVWIVPEKAVVYENGPAAYVVESRLKVMLDEDYLAMAQKHRGTGGVQDVEPVQSGILSAGGIRPVTAIIREILIPEIEKEVNEGRHFAQLRQIYNSMILATWFKRKLKESILGRVYAGKNKVAGVDVEDKEVKFKIYHQYLEAFQKGVVDYIKEEYDPVTQQIIPRKYFSGGIGFQFGDMAMQVVTGKERLSGINADHALLVSINLLKKKAGSRFEPKEAEAAARFTSRDSRSVERFIRRFEYYEQAYARILEQVWDEDGRSLQKVETISRQLEKEHLKLAKTVASAAQKLNNNVFLAGVLQRYAGEVERLYKEAQQLLSAPALRRQVADRPELRLAYLFRIEILSAVVRKHLKPDYEANPDWVKAFYWRSDADRGESSESVKKHMKDWVYGHWPGLLAPEESQALKEAATGLLGSSLARFENQKFVKNWLKITGSIAAIAGSSYLGYLGLSEFQNPEAVKPGQEAVQTEQSLPEAPVNKDEESTGLEQKSAPDRVSPEPAVPQNSFEKQVEEAQALFAEFLLLDAGTPERAAGAAASQEENVQKKEEELKEHLAEKMFIVKKMKALEGVIAESREKETKEFNKLKQDAGSLESAREAIKALHEKLQNNDRWYHPPLSEKSLKEGENRPGEAADSVKGPKHDIRLGDGNPLSGGGIPTKLAEFKTKLTAAKNYLPEEMYFKITSGGFIKAFGMNILWSVSGQKSGEEKTVSSAAGDLVVPNGYVPAGITPDGTILYDTGSGRWSVDPKQEKGLREANVRPATAEELEQLQAPALVVVGENGEDLSRAEAEANFRKLLPAPLREILEIGKTLPKEEREELKRKILGLFYYSTNVLLEDAAYKGATLLETMFTYFAGECEGLSYLYALISWYFGEDDVAIWKGYFSEDGVFYEGPGHMWPVKGGRDIVESTAFAEGVSPYWGKTGVEDGWNKEMEFLKKRASRKTGELELLLLKLQDGQLDQKLAGDETPVQKEITFEDIQEEYARALESYQARINALGVDKITEGFLSELFKTVGRVMGTLQTGKVKDKYELMRYYGHFWLGFLDRVERLSSSEVVKNRIHDLKTGLLKEIRIYAENRKWELREPLKDLPLIDTRGRQSVVRDIFVLKKIWSDLVVIDSFKGNEVVIRGGQELGDYLPGLKAGHVEIEDGTYKLFPYWLQDKSYDRIILFDLPFGRQGWMAAVREDHGPFMTLIGPGAERHGVAGQQVTFFSGKDSHEHVRMIHGQLLVTGYNPENEKFFLTGDWAKAHAGDFYHKELPYLSGSLSGKAESEEWVIFYKTEDEGLFKAFGKGKDAEALGGMEFKDISGVKDSRNITLGLGMNMVTLDRNLNFSIAEEGMGIQENFEDGTWLRVVTYPDGKKGVIGSRARMENLLERRFEEIAAAIETPDGKLVLIAREGTVWRFSGSGVEERFVDGKSNIWGSGKAPVPLGEWETTYRPRKFLALDGQEFMIQLGGTSGQKLWTGSPGVLEMIREELSVNGYRGSFSPDFETSAFAPADNKTWIARHSVGLGEKQRVSFVGPAATAAGLTGKEYLPASEWREVLINVNNNLLYKPVFLSNGEFYFWVADENDSTPGTPVYRLEGTWPQRAGLTHLRFVNPAQPVFRLKPDGKEVDPDRYILTDAELGGRFYGPHDVLLEAGLPDGEVDEILPLDFTADGNVIFRFKKDGKEHTRFLNPPAAYEFLKRSKHIYNVRKVDVIHTPGYRLDLRWEGLLSDMQLILSNEDAPDFREKEARKIKEHLDVFIGDATRDISARYFYGNGPYGIMDVPGRFIDEFFDLNLPEDAGRLNRLFTMFMDYGMEEEVIEIASQLAVSQQHASGLPGDKYKAALKGILPAQKWNHCWETFLENQKKRFRAVNPEYLDPLKFSHEQLEIIRGLNQMLNETGIPEPNKDFLSKLNQEARNLSKLELFEQLSSPLGSHDLEKILDRLRGFTGQDKPFSSEFSLEARAGAPGRLLDLLRRNKSIYKIGMEDYEKWQKIDQRLTYILGKDFSGNKTSSDVWKNLLREIERDALALGVLLWLLSFPASLLGSSALQKKDWILGMTGRKALRRLIAEAKQRTLSGNAEEMITWELAEKMMNVTETWGDKEIEEIKSIRETLSSGSQAILDALLLLALNPPQAATKINPGKIGALIVPFLGAYLSKSGKGLERQKYLKAIVEYVEEQPADLSPEDFYKGLYERVVPFMYFGEKEDGQNTPQPALPSAEQFEQALAEKLKSTGTVTTDGREQPRAGINGRKMNRLGPGGSEVYELGLVRPGEPFDRRTIDPKGSAKKEYDQLVIKKPEQEAVLPSTMVLDLRDLRTINLDLWLEDVAKSMALLSRRTPAGILFLMPDGTMEYQELRGKKTSYFQTAKAVSTARYEEAARYATRQKEFKGMDFYTDQENLLFKEKAKDPLEKLAVYAYGKNAKKGNPRASAAKVKSVLKNGVFYLPDAGNGGLNKLASKLKELFNLPQIYTWQGNKASGYRPREEAPEGDAAMFAEKGGIDLNPGYLDLKTDSPAGNPVPGFDPFTLMTEDFDGFEPVIINVTPVLNLPDLY